MNVFLSPIKEKELFFKRPSLPNCFNERVNKLKWSNHKIHEMLCQKKVKLDNIGRVWDYCWCWCCSFWKFDDGLLRSWYQFSNTLAVAWLMYGDSSKFFFVFWWKVLNIAGRIASWVYHFDSFKLLTKNKYSRPSSSVVPPETFQTYKLQSALILALAQKSLNWRKSCCRTDKL